MQYKDQNLKYEMQSAESAATDGQERLLRKQYRRNRLVRTTRRIAKASKSYAGLGIAGRRNRRWSW